jgi:hypothetical protein
MKYITNAKAIILILSDNTNVRVEKTDKNYAKVLKSFELPKDEQEAAILTILNPIVLGKSAVNDVEGFELIDDEIHYQGERLPAALEQKVLSIMADGLPLDHFAKFWERLQNNPSATSINELVDFLSYKELPITEDGFFIAYKGVDDAYWSVKGNTSTKVLQGTVNSSGQIYNAIGSVIEVPRRGVDDNRANECSFGLHVGSLDYARSWSSRVVVVKVDPADVVSVPKDCSCQKCRVSKYEVLYDFVGEITASVVSDDGEDDIVEEETSNRSEFIYKVAQYLTNKTEAGFEEVTVRQIQNSFSPAWPSREAVLDALQDLFYDWEDDTYVVYL